MNRNFAACLGFICDKMSETADVLWDKIQDTVCTRMQISIPDDAGGHSSETFEIGSIFLWLIARMVSLVLEAVPSPKHTRLVKVYEFFLNRCHRPYTR